MIMVAAPPDGTRLQALRDRAPALVILLAISLLGLCQCSNRRYERNQALHEQSLGTGECALHHTPLVTVAGYRQLQGSCILRVDEFYEAHYRVPNPQPLDWSESSSDLFPTPGEARFCPQCEQSVQDRYSRSRGND